MKSTYRKSVACILSGFLMVPAIALAQEKNEDLMELVEPEATPSATENGAGTQKSEGPVRLSDDEVQKLNDARKGKSEVALLKLTSDILSRDPNNAHALNALGIFYYENKKNGLAKIIFKRALKDNSSIPALHNNLGVVYMAENEMALAIDSFKKAVQLEERYTRSAVNLSSIYLEYRDYQRGIIALEGAAKNIKSDLRRGKGDSLEIANNYAVALMGVGEKDKAGEVFEEIYKSSSRHPTPIFNYLLFLVEVEKNKKDAIKVASKLKSLTEDRDVLQRADELLKKLE